MQLQVTYTSRLTCTFFLYIFRSVGMFLTVVLLIGLLGSLGNWRHELIFFNHVVIA